MKILATLLEMSQNELLSHIDASTYQRIKDRDDHPTFKAYVIGHEGASTGKMVGVGHLIKKWFKSAIVKLNEKLKIGTKVFHGHEQTNDQKDRTQIGEVVGKTLKTIKEFLSSIAITYIYPPFKDKSLDVASVEIQVFIPEDKQDIEIHDVDVQEVQAIALGDSTIDKPGFAQASLLVSIQEFANGHGGDKMTPEEIREAVRTGRLKPSDIFDSDELAIDPLVKQINEKKRDNEDGYQKRMSDKLQTEKATWDKEKKELEDSLNTQKKVNLKIKAKDRIGELIGDKGRKLEEKQVKFINKDIDNFEPSEEDKLDADLNTFIDKELDDFDKTLEALGVKKDAGKEKEEEAGIGAGDETQSDTEDLLNPEKNEFIPI